MSRELLAVSFELLALQFAENVQLNECRAYFACLNSRALDGGRLIASWELKNLAQRQ
jgi:hypothetical protein